MLRKFCILDFSKHQASIQDDYGSLQTFATPIDPLFWIKIYRLERTSKWSVKKELISFGKYYSLKFLTIVYNFPFIIRVSRWRLFCSLGPLCLIRYVRPNILCIHTNHHCLSCLLQEQEQ